MILKNKSVTYLMPFITTKSTMKKDDYISEAIFPTNLFINAYLYYEEIKPEEHYLYLLYLKPNVPVDYFRTIEQKLFFNNPGFVEKIEPTDFHYLYKIQFPDKDHYEKYVNGSYSKFEPNMKKRILDFWNLPKEEYSSIRGVLYKEDRKREEIEKKIGMKLSLKYELSSKPELELETYKSSFFKQGASDTEV